MDQDRNFGTQTGGIWDAETGATLEFIGSPNYTEFGGTFSGSGGGTVQLNSGPFYIDSPSATFNFPTGLLHWAGGSIYGNTLTNSGFMTLASSADKTLYATLNNNGAIIEKDTGNLVVNGTLNNNATGVIDFQDDAGIAGGGSIENSGTIQKSAGTGVSSIGPSPSSSLYFDQLGGKLDAQTGTLQLNQDRNFGTQTGGIWDAETGATLEFIGSPNYTAFGGTFSGSGGGTVQFSSGPFYINSPGATFNFPTGLLHWVGGSISGYTLTNSGFITLASSADKTLYATLNNNGTIIEKDTGNLVVNGRTQQQRHGPDRFPGRCRHRGRRYCQ